ncbi:DUF1992 domain-containing protein [Amycolatopsis sp.]|uniref:DnaJ family domain-containing protein n=1 Tax=Amycolatopsis sp. TaxID=37632 RepID=UPI002CEF1E4C|nr:DUF1992 domain-containing protein [Amycolatopsis sp.]HVV07881.1 DUF1992 domain-containing protein [Amycolatopsis sp.]
MTERKPRGTSVESWVDEQIRRAQERGEFENLPGAGKPLPGLRERDENWWIKQKLDREGLSADALLPESLRLRKQISQLPETVHALRTEHSVRAAVAELNTQIVAWLRAPSGPNIPVAPVDVEKVVAQWRATRPPEPEVQQPEPETRKRWWRR